MQLQEPFNLGENVTNSYMIVVILLVSFCCENTELL
jgi:hypothetical protein